MSSFIGKTFSKLVGTPNSNSNKLGSTGNNNQNTNESTSSSGKTTPVLPTSTSTSQYYKNTNQLSSNNASASSFYQDTQLTLTHLRKIFYEFLHPKNQYEVTNQTERDHQLYSILPLFIKAFSHSSLNDIQNRFSDVAEFCYVCSNLLVSEISKRVHDDLVLVKFLEIKTNDETIEDGSSLLNVVHLLASGPPFLIEIMTKCALPSRLVMCVFLFTCLPEAKDSVNDKCEFNAFERRILFQKCLHQVKLYLTLLFNFFFVFYCNLIYLKLLMKLCQYSFTANELIEGDSLKILFKIIASNCDKHNIAWRQTARDALLTLTKSFDANGIQYIHGNLIYTIYNPQDAQHPFN
jgi:hypothetical protein